MEFIYQLALLLHIIGGFTAIVVLWIPIFTRKGGKLHIRSGWVFVIAMTSVSISALYMGIYRLLRDAGALADDVAFSWFLIFIAILSGAAAWHGIRVLRFKQRNTAHRKAIDLFFPILLLISSIAVSLLGWKIDFPLLQYFPLIGLFLGGTQLFYWLSTPKRKSHWIVEHIIGMLSCCVAAITAFIVFGAPRMVNIESVSLILWFLPTIIFVPLIIGFSAYYSKRIDGKNSLPK